MSYQCAISPDKLEKTIHEAEHKIGGRRYVLISSEAYLTHASELAPFKFTLGVADSGMYRADDSEHLRVFLHNKGIEFEALTESAPDDPDSFKREQLEAVKRWFYDDWRRIEPKLRTSIARQEQSGLPAITIRDLLKASLRHRPDRIILGEIRGGEAFDLLQLLNTGHSGTLSTVHASSAAQALARFTSCVLQSGIDLPYRAIKSNIADSLSVLVQLERRPGKRFVSEVLEIRDYDPQHDSYDLSSVFAVQL